MRAEIGKMEEPRILAQQEVTIAAGERAEVVLSVGELPKPERVELVVTVKLDPVWKLERFNLVVRPSDVQVGPDAQGTMIQSGSMIVVDPSTWKAKPIRVDAGRYEFSLYEVNFGIDEMVGPGPRQLVVFELPTPSRVVVRAIDGESGEPLTGVTYFWRWKGPRDTRFRSNGRGWPQTAPGQFEFLAPTGTVEVEASTTECSPVTQTLEVVPGANDVTLTLQRNYRVELVLHERDKIVPWAMGWVNGFTLERVDGRRLPGMQTSVGAGRLTCSVPEPGVYRVILPAMSGYLKVEPFEVTLDERKLIEKIVQIVRE
jgi:hypothetical protein